MLLLLLFFNIYLFIYLWLHWVFVAVLRLSLVVARGGLLFVAVCWLLIAVASLVVEHGLLARGLSSCGSWAVERGLSSCGARA